MRLNLLKETGWAEKGGPVAFKIGMATFGILALELAIIRWSTTQIRIFAYFNNIVLIGAFLGMGIGVALGKRFSGLVHLTLPSLFLVGIPFAFSQKFGLVHLKFPDTSVYLWGAEHLVSLSTFSLNIAIFLCLFCFIVTVFIFAGTPVGYLFGRIATLRAYSADLLGSLLGIIAFTIATSFSANPPIWFMIGGLPFCWLSRKWYSITAFLGILILSAFSIQGAIYSPYNRIDVKHDNPVAITIRVNRDFHQYMHDFSELPLSREELSQSKDLLAFGLRRVYDLPFFINDARRRALIVGAGTGNDVQAAIRNDYAMIYSVDIDGEIIALGQSLHPEQPYQNSEVIPVVNDARPFFEQYQGEPFDVVSFGFLDSHAMFSSMSSLRLDNYVYTEDSIRSAWELVSDRGHLSITISVYAGEWFFLRLYTTIAKATGIRPLSLFHEREHFSVTFIVPKESAKLNYARLNTFQTIDAGSEIPQVRTTSDDWPFLYIRPGVFPWGYLLVLLFILLLGTGLVVFAFGKKNVVREFDSTLFLMGTSFLLLETRGITSLSLLFGSTWIVNSAIFAAILTMVLLANLVVMHFSLRDPTYWFLGLFFAVVLVCYFPVSELNHFEMLPRSILGGLLIAIPIFFAGIIVPILLSRSANPTSALGSNLLGSVLGGCLEYLSMLFGLQFLAQLALLIYIIAFLFYRLKNQSKTDV